MPSDRTAYFAKENLDMLLKELAKEFRRLNRKGIPAELILIKNLYGSWEDFSADSVLFIYDSFQKGDYEKVYAAVTEEEKRSKDMLVDFEKDYPGVATDSNVGKILASLKRIGRLS